MLNQNQLFRIDPNEPVEICMGPAKLTWSTESSVVSRGEYSSVRTVQGLGKQSGTVSGYRTIDRSPF